MSWPEKEMLNNENRDPNNEEEICEECGGTGEVDVIEPVYPGEPHMADVGTRPCVCQIKDEDEQ